MILDVDFNDTLVNNTDEIIRASEGRLDHSHFTGWDPSMGKPLGMTDREALRWAFGNADLQMSALPHVGAREAIQELRLRGSTVNIVTATCLSLKQVSRWLDEHNIVVDGIVMSRLKNRPHLLIDDKLETAQERAEAGLPTLVFSQRWNASAPGPHLDCWSNLSRILELV